MKICPYCQSEIVDEAIKCKYCGEFVERKYRDNNITIPVKSFRMPPKIYCPACQYEGRTSKTGREGSIIITVVLLFFWIIPGLLYEIWRGSSYYICPKCGSKTLNKVDN